MNEIFCVIHRKHSIFSVPYTEGKNGEKCIFDSYLLLVLFSKKSMLFSFIAKQNRNSIIHAVAIKTLVTDSFYLSDQSLPYSVLLNAQVQTCICHFHQDIDRQKTNFT